MSAQSRVALDDLHLAWILVAIRSWRAARWRRKGPAGGSVCGDGQRVTDGLFLAGLWRGTTSFLPPLPERGVGTRRFGGAHELVNPLLGGRSKYFSLPRVVPCFPLLGLSRPVGYS